MESINSPLFSVVMPLYNKELYVAQAVESVLAQNYRHFELIIIDDGSTDSSATVVKSKFSDTFITLIRQPNSGQGEARNAGIRRARGSWVAFIDADDQWSPSHLSELLNVIRTFNGTGLVATRSISTSVGVIPEMLSSSEKVRCIDYFSEASVNIGIVHTSAAAIAKTAFDRVGLFGNYPAGQDLEMWARVALEFPVALSNRVTSIYYRGTGGVTDQMADNSANSARPSPKTLTDLSPSVAMLVERIRNNSIDKTIIDTVVRYINSRVSHTVRSALISGDVPRVKAVGTLYIPPCKHSNLFWSQVSSLPAPILEIVSRTRFLARKIYHMKRRQ